MAGRSTRRAPQQPRRVKLPSYLQALAGAREGTTAVVHAALDARELESGLAIALSTRGEVVLVAARTDKARWLIRRWVGKASANSVGKYLRYELGGTNLWLAKNPNDIEEIPAAYTDALVIVGAHAIRSSPAKRMRANLRGPITVFGNAPVRGHWWREFAAEAGRRITVDHTAVVAEYEDQRARVPTRRDWKFERFFELKDVDPVRPSMLTFARRRLKMLTDKRADYLDPVQLESARAQFGPKWGITDLSQPMVPFIYSPIQKFTSAHQRIGRRRGYRKFGVLKYRRAGETRRNQSEGYEKFVNYSGVAACSVSDTEAKGRKLFGVIEGFVENDPEAPRVVRRNQTEIELENGSVFSTWTAGGRSITRGLTLQDVHGYEVPYWCKGPRQMELVEELMSGLTEAASNGEIRLEGTPRGREWFWKTYNDSKKGINDWWFTFLRWFDDRRNVAAPGTYNQDEIIQTLTEEERLLCERHGLTVGQLAFRRDKRRTLGRLFAQEYPEDDETCFIVGGTCFFDIDLVLEMIAALEHDKRVGKKVHIPGGYEITWEEPQPGVEYVAGCDTSEGLEGCDPCGIGIQRRDTGAQVAAIHGLFRPSLLAEHAVRMCTKYNRALLGVERENHGHAVIQSVIQLGYGRPHYRGGPLYYHSDRDPREDVALEKTARAGWTTNAVTRSPMLEDLEKTMRFGDWVRDLDFLSECLSFRLQSNGRFEADAGAHDDTVIKWAIARQMLVRTRPEPEIIVLKGVP